MKLSKTLLFIGLLFIGYTVSAQKAVVGISGGFGTTWLLNKNVFDRGPELDPVVSLGGNYGLAATVYFTDKVGLGIEISNAIVNQKYKGVIGVTSYDTKTKLTFLEVPLLLKLKSGPSGFYFEIGPKLSYTLSATETYGSGIYSAYLGGGSVKNDFNSALISGVIGIGGRINVVDALTISIGVRFAGSISDATQEYDLTVSNPNASYAGIAANTKNDGTFDYKRTTLASGGLQFGLLYRIGK